MSTGPRQQILGIDSELAEAIARIAEQYKGVPLKAVEWLERKEDYLPFVPKPAADESWSSGGRVVFKDPDTRKVLHSGEVAEYDPDTGAIFVDISEWDQWQQAARCWLEFFPFNFGDALHNAFEQLSPNTEALKWALRNVSGDIVEDSPAEPGVGSQDFWDLPWGIVWGPPGTGKTETVSEYLAQWASKSKGGTILVATPTNNAADQMALRLKKHLSTLGGHLRDGHCLVHRGGRGSGRALKKEFPDCLRDPSFARQHAEISEAMEELEKRRAALIYERNFPQAARLRREIAALQGQLPDQTQQVISEGAVRIVIVTTFKALQFAGSGDFVGLFDKVVIDEAGMVSRAVSAAIAAMGRSVVLAGDPKQIGPIYKVPHGIRADVRKWLSLSGLSHLDSAKAALSKKNVKLLRTQYRMHPEISKAVSEYCYDGILLDGASVLADSAAASPAEFPEFRASWIVVDSFADSPEACCSRRASPGTGHVREASAEACALYGQMAARQGHPALILTPYRAQVRLILRKLAGKDSGINVGTIHRQQGAEREVVILDLVNGASAFTSAEIRMIVNVAMSRAKRHLIVIASKGEMRSPVLRPLANLLKPSVKKKMETKTPGLGNLLDLIRPSEKTKEAQRLATALAGLDTSPSREGFLTPRNWGHEIKQLRNRRPLFSAEQVRLIEKNIGEGHRLVRGVAGSGKSLILTAWAVKLMHGNPSHKVLITYFNKGMKILLSTMVETAARELDPMAADRILRQVTITHHAALARRGKPTFDAVFVDEAQDMDADTLRDLYDSCHATTKGLKNFILFADDSQNIYGKKTLDELRSVLPAGLDFRGRSDVLRETYRSTQTILSLAVNLALDPKNVYGLGASRLLEYMRVAELAQEGLLIRPEDSPEGAYSVCYTEREGVPTRYLRTPSEKVTLARLSKEIKRLVAEEGLALGDVLVVTVKRPERVADALNAVGIKATAFGGKKGANTLGMPGAGGDSVRCTTVFTSKGHESPVSFFLWPEELEDIHTFMKIPGATDADFERIRRCMLYVSISRAMFIQYILGAESRFMKAIDTYHRSDIGRVPVWT